MPLSPSISAVDAERCRTVARFEADVDRLALRGLASRHRVTGAERSGEARDELRVRPRIENVDPDHLSDHREECAESFVKRHETQTKGSDPGVGLG